MTSALASGKLGRMRRLVWLMMLGALAVVPAVALASSSSRQVWVTSTCHREQYKPTTIVLACANGNTFIHRLRWSKWTSTKAIGRGDEAINTCQPDCATGRVTQMAVTVALGKPGSCAGHKHKVFTQARLDFGRRRRVGSDALGCPT